MEDAAVEPGVGCVGLTDLQLLQTSDLVLHPTQLKGGTSGSVHHGHVSGNFMSAGLMGHIFCIRGELHTLYIESTVCTGLEHMRVLMFACSAMLAEAVHSVVDIANQVSSSIFIFSNRDGAAF